MKLIYFVLVLLSDRVQSRIIIDLVIDLCKYLTNGCKAKFNEDAYFQNENIWSDKLKYMTKVVL